MTDKELKRLSRGELLEMLLFQTQEVDRLKQELENAEERLQQRKIDQENAGSIAQAALQLNGVFDAAQAAADQYLENIKALEAKSIERCRLMEERTKDKCRAYVRKAESDAAGYWEELLQKLREADAENEWREEAERHMENKKREKFRA